MCGNTSRTKRCWAPTTTARAGRRTLRPGGRLYFEIYEHFAEAMRRMLGEEGYTDTEVREDLNGKPRMTCSRLK